jgi:hypothetical protein
LEWLVKATIVFGSLLVLAWLTPLRLLVSFAASAFRAARALGASALVGRLTAAWVIAGLTGVVALLVVQRMSDAALAAAALPLPFALLWLHRVVRTLRSARDGEGL